MLFQQKLFQSLPAVLSPVERRRLKGAIGEMEGVVIGRRSVMVITGPLFSSNDPVYKNDRMNYSVRCPLQFWKVCVLIRLDDTPAATGFVLGQEDIQSLPGFEEAFNVAAAQIRIADLEKRTGLDFGRLRDFDHFAQGGAPGTLEVPTAAGASLPIKVIRGGEDIVI